MPDTRQPRVADLDGVFLRALGLVGETFNAMSINASLAMAGGSVYFGLIPLRAGTVVTNIVTQVQTAGSGLTLVRLGLYSKAGVRLAQTADAAAAFASIGNKVTALTAPLVVPAEDGYYIAIIATGTTPPNLREGLAEADLYTAIGSGVRRFAIQAGQTDLPATATLADSQNCPWLAAS